MISYDMMLTAAKALSDKKASNLKVLEIKHLSTLADYLVICNGNSTTQIKALADECEYQMTQKGYVIDHREGLNEGGWVLLDYIDVIVHIYNKESRKFYDLERFWKDGIELDIEDKIEGKTSEEEK